jgi:hypothetical protein
MNSSILYRFSFNSRTKIKIARFIISKEYFISTGGRPGMKRVLLLGFILAICILAMPQGVLADPAAQPITINAQYGSATTFTVTGADGTSTTIDMGLLKASDDNLKPAALHFNVKSQSKWIVTGKDVSNGGSPAHPGYMEGSQGPLQDPFKMYTKQDGDTTWHNFAGTVTVYHADPSDSAVPWNEDVMQHVYDNDYGSTGNYNIALEFDCQATF